MIKWIRDYFISAFISLSFALKRVDDELRADPIDLFKTEQRAEMRSMFSMFDEKYVQQFYEILKKADKFLRTSNPAKIQRTAAKFGLNYGMKDHNGRRFEHYGFFDDKHKYAGKSLNEVRELEVSERKIVDDDYPVIVMYVNKKEFSFSESANIILNNSKVGGFYAPEIHELARMKKYPLTIVRDDKTVRNKIEQLTEYLHVKEISSEHKILEFFIPKKFGVENIGEDDPIFKEVVNIKQVWFKDEYGDRNSYAITSFYKRSDYMKYITVKENGIEKEVLNPSGYDIIKFKATDIVVIK
jgi:hypothetical protein